MRGTRRRQIAKWAVGRSERVLGLAQQELDVIPHIARSVASRTSAGGTALDGGFTPNVGGGCLGSREVGGAVQ